MCDCPFKQKKNERNGTTINKKHKNQQQNENNDGPKIALLTHRILLSCKTIALAASNRQKESALNWCWSAVSSSKYYVCVCVSNSLRLSRDDWFLVFFVCMHKRMWKCTCVYFVYSMYYVCKILFIASSTFVLFTTFAN